MNKFERLLIKLLLKILPWPIIRELHSEAQDKFNETVWSNHSEMAKQAAKEMKEFLSKQSDSFKDELNKQAMSSNSLLVNLVPIGNSGFTPNPTGVFKKDGDCLKLEEYIPPTKEQIKAYEDYMTNKIIKEFNAKNNTNFK